MMIAAGVPLPIVSRTLRHSTVSITADVYTHMTETVAPRLCRPDVRAGQQVCGVA